MGHAALLVEQGGVRLLTDPFLRSRLGHVHRVAPAPAAGVLRGLDAVLISHVHADHLDPSALKVLDAPRVIVPAGAERWAGLRGVRGMEPMTAGEETQVGDVTVRAVASEHGRRRPGTRLAADPLGFVMSAGRSVYFAGDTDVFPGMADIAPVDVALLPVWGWGPRVGPGHMDPARAAAAVELLRPTVAIPIHWGTYIAATVLRGRATFLTEPPRTFADAVAAATPEVDVRILPPGATTELAR